MVGRSNEEKCSEIERLNSELRQWKKAAVSVCVRCLLLHAARQHICIHCTPCAPVIQDAHSTLIMQKSAVQLLKAEKSGLEAQLRSALEELSSIKAGNTAGLRQCSRDMHSCQLCSALEEVSATGISLYELKYTPGTSAAAAWEHHISCPLGWCPRLARNTSSHSGVLAIVISVLRTLDCCERSCSLHAASEMTLLKQPRWQPGSVTRLSLNSMTPCRALEGQG